MGNRKLLATLKPNIGKNYCEHHSRHLLHQEGNYTKYDGIDSISIGSQSESLDSHSSQTETKKHIQSHWWPCGKRYPMFASMKLVECISGFQRLVRRPWWRQPIKDGWKAPFVFKCLQIFAIWDKNKECASVDSGFVYQRKRANYWWMFGDKVWVCVVLYKLLTKLVLPVPVNFQEFETFSY